MQEVVLGKVRPGLSDKKRIAETSAAIIARVENLAKERGFSIQAILVGSAARGTWLSGDHDLDIFLGVPPEGDLGAALEIARLAAPHHEEKYAEHAYIHARMDDFEVDLVPCYLVDDAADLKSAVDRTPFHTKYVSMRIKGKEDDVLLLKQFMKGVNVYGSELKTGGFSGYLTELLVLCYGSFAAVLQAASSWRPGQLLDLEGHAAVRHDEPLIVVDPVDPRRNVAAALTLDKMLQFAGAARSFLAGPKLDFFFPPSQPPLSDEELTAQVIARGTMPILLEFAAPDVVEDVLYPQLRKAEGSIKALLERNGFAMLRSDVSTYRDRAVMLFEMQVWQLSKACLRIGPPAWEAEHAARFLAAHPNILSGPYIADGKIVVEETRQYTFARDLLDHEIANLSLGKHLCASIREGHNIYVGLELLGIKDEGFRIFLAHYFNARLRIV
ncbi:MAG: CCA tRNA nucleotidyltransferase [Methanothrix sp.]|nr:CCA tRNA nucleotidyltransferase [Methanothrix sp.]